ncbi:PilZ domain-containing protein [Hyphococcus sp. DH-69]|uniref:PilZ domain-containing protein n=1 Tax=Hyphococcus formosus TaxID=3143534 RepID=UPI00398A7BB0
MAKKDKARIANRLAAISSAAPTISDGRIPPPKRRGPPQREPREPVFRPGVLFVSRSHQVRCVIRNLSTSGAYLHVEGEHPLPPIVVLKFLQTGTVKKSRVIWQNETEVGLQFLDDKNPDEDSADS